MVKRCSCDPVALALAAAQNAALQSLTDSCVVVGKGEGVEAAYGYTYPETRKVYPCSILTHSGEKETLAGDRTVSTYDTTILLPLNAVVTSSDVIEAKGNKYEIIATDQGKTGALVIAVAARKVPL